jgi:hypothetical protein
VGIRGFIWTDHAELRLEQRGLVRFEVEEAIREGHETREINAGNADWRIYGERSDGCRYVVVYDSPVEGDESTARIVSAWPLRSDRVS